MASIHIGQPWHTDPRRLSLREFTGTQEDYEALAHIRNETMRAVSLPEHFHEMSAQEIARFYNRGEFDLVGNAWLMFHADRPVAAGVVYPKALFEDRPPGNFDMYVVPTLWQHGIGSRLLAHLEQAALARGHPVLETTIAREDERSTGFLLRRGFQVVGQSAHLTRPLTGDLPAVTLPEGYTIRSLADLKAPPEFYRDTTNRLGAYDPNYSLITPEDMAALIESNSWEPKGVLFLFDAAGRIVGVIRAGGGYLHEIRVEPASRGRGLGMALLAAALRYLAEAGAKHADLQTTGENTPAHNLAVKAGFVPTRHWLHLLKRLSTEQARPPTSPTGTA
jgi:GNAT superfamily N-acetyltransferase